MITDIKVDGFRSLLNFSAELHPGVNIVVGPNGSGKTNFIEFLNFAAKIVSDGVNAAISHTEGAGSTFSREAFGRETATLDFSISGVTTSSFTPSNKHDLSGVLLDYQWSCKIVYDRRIPAIYIASETVKFTFEGKRPFILRRSTSRSEALKSARINLNAARHPILKDSLSFRSSREKSDGSEHVLPDRFYVIDSGTSIFSKLYENFYFSDIAFSDITSLKSINIDPAIARRPSSVTSKGEILSNGSGLAGVLYRLRRGDPILITFLADRDRDQTKAIFSSIVSWCREINPSIEDIDVSLDFTEALLKPNLLYCDGDKRTNYPFSRLSDGTVKWIALTTMLFAQSTYATIEEPENFLHPLMQVTFIKLCRELSARSVNKIQMVISTHSLTILDQCTPDELMLFENIEGATICSRVANADSLNKKLDESRFGLGYLYRSGVVYGTHDSDR